MLVFIFICGGGFYNDFFFNSHCLYQFFRKQFVLIILCYSSLIVILPSSILWGGICNNFFFLSKEFAMIVLHSLRIIVLVLSFIGGGVCRDFVCNSDCAFVHFGGRGL